MVELCKSRSAILLEDSGQQQAQAPSPTGDTNPADSLQIKQQSQVASAVSNSMSTTDNSSDSDSDAQPSPAQAALNPQLSGPQVSTQPVTGSSTQHQQGPVGTGSSDLPAGSSDLPGGAASRTNLMNLSGSDNFFVAFQRSLALGGQSAFLLRVLLGNLTKRTAGGSGGVWPAS